jgi:hypothetical protein
MAVSRKKVWPEHFPEKAKPIRYLTENGFSIVRLSDLDPATINSPSASRFLIQLDDGPQHEVCVSFDEQVLELLRLRRRIPLSPHSLFWLVCAESYLANYLWESNHLPPDEHLHIKDLSPDELMLALHWSDQD